MAIYHSFTNIITVHGQHRNVSLADQHKAVAEDEELQEILQNPNSDEAKEALRNLKEYQEEKFKGVRASTKANDNDIVKTWGKISDAVCTTYLLCDLYSN